jgi:hypothetical protein
LEAVCNEITAPIKVDIKATMGIEFTPMC